MFNGVISSCNVHPSGSLEGREIYSHLFGNNNIAQIHAADCSLGVPIEHRVDSFSKLCTAGLINTLSKSRVEQRTACIDSCLRSRSTLDSGAGRTPREKEAYVVMLMYEE